MGMGDQNEITLSQFLRRQLVIGEHPPPGEQLTQRRTRKKGIDRQDLPAVLDLDPGNPQPTKG
jgi:hypothetical protein